MKSGGQRRIKAVFFAAIFLCIATMAFADPFSLSSSNAVSASQYVVTDNGTILPLVSMQDVPISAAIENLGRQAGINFMIDRRLMDWWNYTDDFGRELHNEPAVSVHWTNITAYAALVRILEEHHLVLAYDPQTSVARVTYPNQIMAPADPALLAKNTNIVARIQFEEVPISVALENLAKQVPLNYLLDPQLGNGWPDKYGNMKREPDVNLLWQNITAPQALVAVCQNYGLVLMKDPVTGVVFIRAKNHPAHFVDATLFGRDTNIIPVIEFQDVPLTVALLNLARQGHINYLLDPKIGYGSSDKNGNIKEEPNISFRCENITATDAFIEICENFGLVVVKDSAGNLRLKPSD